MTLLSIIVPNYNYGHFLKDCLDSVLLTNLSHHFELIFIDDGSTDRSREIVACYQHDPRLRIVFNESNRGISETVNRGMAQAEGSYVHFLASDDIHIPGTVDFMINTIIKYPTTTLFSSDLCYFFSTQERFTTCFKPASLHAKELHCYDPHQAKMLFTHTPFWIPGNTVFVNKKIFLEYGWFEAKWGPLSDWLVHHQIAIEQGVGYVPKTLTAMRRHPGGYSQNLTLSQKHSLWLDLMQECKKNPRFKALSQTGLFRMFGLRAIYKQLLFNPYNWPFLIPMMRKLVPKKNHEKFWI